MNKRNDVLRASPVASMELGHRAWLLLLAVAIATRALQFGNPVIQVDEQFYLFVGDRLLHGALPYVDIWDRKPFGLFAIYALIRTLGGTGILHYQLAAMLFVVLTASIISKISLRLTNPGGAAVSGMVYIVYILSSGGDGGQAPVFYNAFVACAALLVLKVQERPWFDMKSALLAGCAILILGLAIQVKYTVIFEGAFFGLWLLWIAHSKGVGLPALTGYAMSWATIALLPTIFVFLAYWTLGHSSEFVFANFLSIFHRSSGELDIPGRVLAIVAHIAVPGGAALWAMTRASSNPPARNFVFAWTGSAILAVILFGTYHDHYALPLFVPIAIAGASLYGDVDARLPLWRFRPRIAHCVLLIGLLMGVGTMIATRLNRGTGDGVYAAARIVGRDPERCIYVFSGDPILYYLTRSCLPTAFTFPSLLSERSDSVSIGRDPMRELHATMARSPTYVFVRLPVLTEIDKDSWAFVKDQIARDYHLTIRQRVGRSVMLGFKRNAAR